MISVASPFMSSKGGRLSEFYLADNPNLYNKANLTSQFIQYLWVSGFQEKYHRSIWDLFFLNIRKPYLCHENLNFIYLYICIYHVFKCSCGHCQSSVINSPKTCIITQPWLTPGTADSHTYDLAYITHQSKVKFDRKKTKNNSNKQSFMINTIIRLFY